MGLQRADALGQGPAAGVGGGRACGRVIGRTRCRHRRDCGIGGEHGLDRRIRPFELHRKLGDFGGDIIDALAQQRVPIDLNAQPGESPVADDPRGGLFR